MLQTGNQLLTLLWTNSPPFRSNLIIILAVLFTLIALCIIGIWYYIQWDVKKEVKGYPRKSMFMCDKHGMLSIPEETIELPHIPTVDGSKMQMCLYCYDESSKAIDKKLKDAKKAI